MYRFIITFLLLGANIPLSAQRTSERVLGDFDEISAHGNIHLYLIHGDENRMEVEAFGTSPENLNVEISNYRLKIRTHPAIFSDVEFKVYVTYQELRLIKANAGSQVYSDYIVKGRSLELSVGSGSEMDLEVNTGSLKLRAGEGSILEVEGFAQHAEATVNTGGELEAQDLESLEMYIKVHTGGMAQVFTEEVLHASVGTGGELCYRGDPKRKRIKTSLGGEVARLP